MVTSVNQQKEQLFRLQGQLGLNGDMSDSAIKKREEELEQERVQHAAMIEERLKEEKQLQGAIE